MLRVRLTTSAKQDFADAFVWYECDQPGLGEAFRRQLESQLSRIARMPDAGAAIDPRFRRVVVRRYPCVVVYEHDHEQLVVHAVFHTSRNPSQLERRLRSS